MRVIASLILSALISSVAFSDERPTPPANLSDTLGSIYLSLSGPLGHETAGQLNGMIDRISKGGALTDVDRALLARLPEDQFNELMWKLYEPGYGDIFSKLGAGRTDGLAAAARPSPGPSPAPSPAPTTAQRPPGGGGGGGGGGQKQNPPNQNQNQTQTAAAGGAGGGGGSDSGGNDKNGSGGLKPPTIPTATASSAVNLGAMIAGASGSSTGKSDGGIFAALAATGKPSGNNSLTFTGTGGDLRATWDSISRTINGMLTLGGSSPSPTVVASAAPTGTSSGPVPSAGRSPAFMASDRLVDAANAPARGGYDFGAAAGSSAATRFLLQEPAAVKAAAAGAQSSEGSRVRVFGGEYGESTGESSSGTISLRNGGASADSNEPIRPGGHKGAN